MLTISLKGVYNVDMETTTEETVNMETTLIKVTALVAVPNYGGPVGSHLICARDYLQLDDGELQVLDWQETEMKAVQVSA